MTYTTKYNLGDTVFIMTSNSIQAGVVDKITIQSREWNTSTGYDLKMAHFGDVHMFESEMYATKADLIATL